MKKTSSYILFLVYSSILTFVLSFFTPVKAIPQVSIYTPQVQLLMFIVIIFSVIIATIVFTLMIYILIRFRESSKSPRKKIQNEIRLE
ncbi:MAG: hypothetical protein ACFFDT_30475, partial [Candidatus Hodarchaeota archaeon]